MSGDGLDGNPIYKRWMDGLTDMDVDEAARSGVAGAFRELWEMAQWMEELDLPTAEVELAGRRQHTGIGRLDESGRDLRSSARQILDSGVYDLLHVTFGAFCYLGPFPVGETYGAQYVALPEVDQLFATSRLPAAWLRHLERLRTEMRKFATDVASAPITCGEMKGLVLRAYLLATCIHQTITVLTCAEIMLDG